MLRFPPAAAMNSITDGACPTHPRVSTVGIEPDKVGELGIGYALFYEMTDDRKYLAAAIDCANALAAHVRPGDDTHTPWPFRVNGRTGATLDGETFGGIVVSPVAAFRRADQPSSGRCERLRAHTPNGMDMAGLASTQSSKPHL